MSIRDERLKEVLRDLGARFLMDGSNGSSLITVTSVVLRGDGKYATIFFTVFPDEYQKTALEFAKRKRSEFKQFVKENSRLGRIPMLDFEIDLGEKNRQKIDALLNESEREHSTKEEDENVDDGIIGRGEDE
jgi:ribosome-binding factor A